jgi:hypothetical protein
MALWPVARCSCQLANAAITTLESTAFTGGCAPLSRHREINVTHQVYGHLLPSAAKRAVAALDAEFAEWSTG